MEAITNYKGFYKVNQEGFIFIRATFYNPSTNEAFVCCVRDLDDDRKIIEELYEMPINVEMRKVFVEHQGYAYEGSEIEIFKGRKMVGEKKIVKRDWEYKDRFGRVVAIYYIFTDGTKCNFLNCRLTTTYDKPNWVEYENVKENIG